MKYLILCILFGMLAVMPCLAEEDESVYKLGTVVVEESSGVMDISTNNTITGEEILAMGANNVAEALQFTPGVHFSYKNRGYQPVIVQGIGQDQVLLLIDGLPVVPGGGELDLNSIPASIISKIEVIKGASSVLFGPNTMGGVINIITKKGTKGTHGSVRAEIGEHGYNHESGSISHGGEKFSGIVLIDHTGRDSYELSNDFTAEVPEVEDGGLRQNSKFESTNIWARQAYKPDENTELYFNVFNFNVDREVPPNTITTRPFKRKVDDYKVIGMSLTGKKNVTDYLSLRGNAFLQKRSEVIKEYEDVELTTLTRNLPDESYIIGLDIFSDIALAEWNSLSVGVHLKTEELIDDTEPVGGTFTSKEANAYTVSYSVEDTMRFGSTSVVAGIAFNGRKLYDIKTSSGVKADGKWKDTIDPMIGISHTFSNGTRVYGSIARKTTYPSIGSTWDDTSATVYDLDPEKDTIFTMGADHTFFDKLNVNLAIFKHDIEDKIERDLDTMIPRNAGDLDISGFETIFTYSVNNRLKIGADYSLTVGDGTKVRATAYGDELERELYGLTLACLIPRIEAQLTSNLRYTVDNYDDYGRAGSTPREDRKTTAVDLSLTKTFSNNIQIIGRIKNLLDDNIEYEAGQPLEGRTFRLGVVYSF
ncbi:MAG: TonB-dependent receptor [Desulfobacteraceae bacterium]